MFYFAISYYCIIITITIKIIPILLSVCITGVPGCLQSAVIGDVVGDRPGTVLPWRPSRNPPLCGVRLQTVMQATAHRSATLSDLPLNCNIRVIRDRKGCSMFDSS